MTAVEDIGRSHRHGQLAIGVAAIVWSSAGPLQRALHVDAPTQVAGRAVFAGATLLLLVIALERRSSVAAFRAMGRWGWLLAFFLAVSSGTFFLALNHTTVANVLFMQAVAPMMAALLGWALLADRIPSRTWVAMAVAAAGVALMVGDSISGGLLAFCLPFVMTASFAAVIVIARHRRDVSMLPATSAAQGLLVLAFAPFVSFGAADGRDWALFAILGIGQMGVGLALLTLGARLIPPAEVALISLIEIVLGPLWVWLAYGEQPGAATLAGGAVVLVAVLIQATAEIGARRPRLAETHAP